MSGKSSGVRLRPATQEDIPAIVMVSNSSIGEGEEIGFGTPRSELVFSDEARLSAAWEDPNFVREEEVWVAELDGRVVGCVTVEDRGEALELINIDVARDFQGRGIGTRMVRLVEARARREGKRSVTLGTSRNAAGVAWKSLSWWQSRGYRITGEEENDWTGQSGRGAGRFGWRRRFLRQPRSSCGMSRKRISRSSSSTNATLPPISWPRSLPVTRPTEMPSTRTGNEYSTTIPSS